MPETRGYVAEDGYVWEVDRYDIAFIVTTPEATIAKGYANVIPEKLLLRIDDYDEDATTDVGQDLESTTQ